MHNKRNQLFVIFILIGLVSINFQLYSQSPYMKKMKTQRIAFFTERLDLSEEEAQNFWPVYNNYSDSKEKNNSRIRSLTRYVSENIDDLNEKEVEESLQKYIQLEKNSHELFIQYNEKFLDILPPSKVMKLYITETQFKQYLLRQIGEPRQQRMQRN